MGKSTFTCELPAVGTEFAGEFELHTAVSAAVPDDPLAAWRLIWSKQEGTAMPQLTFTCSYVDPANPRRYLENQNSKCQCSLMAIWLQLPRKTGKWVVQTINKTHTGHPNLIKPSKSPSVTSTASPPKTKEKKTKQKKQSKEPVVQAAPVPIFQSAPVTVPFLQAAPAPVAPPATSSAPLEYEDIAQSLLRTKSTKAKGKQVLPQPIASTSQPVASTSRLVPSTSQSVQSSQQPIASTSRRMPLLLSDDESSVDSAPPRKMPSPPKVAVRPQGLHKKRPRAEDSLDLDEMNRPVSRSKSTPQASSSKATNGHYTWIPSKASTALPAPVIKKPRFIPKPAQAQALNEIQVVAGPSKAPMQAPASQLHAGAPSTLQAARSGVRSSNIAQIPNTREYSPKIGDTRMLDSVKYKVTAYDRQTKWIWMESV